MWYKVYFKMKTTQERAAEKTLSKHILLTEAKLLENIDATISSPGGLGPFTPG